ncbi:putative pentatricopeptide repeat-containing protein [Prunus yedoensis var. nudiflora]|uniref:Putative pentatricopeptide repeat-containing protein n=1 Tax=Prunus yedoensis var. nudiflora TaxID=2094558 RepID=A0A314XTZ2_PRUYE|nr:putative pentatricopeptide repeat-containing protein [Prunus yedoensis var. nudiflora]
MPARDVVAWTAMIAGYTSCSHHSHAWALFCEMVRNEMEPNAFTFSSVLKACKGMKALSCGALVHGGLSSKACRDPFMWKMHSWTCLVVYQRQIRTSMKCLEEI